MEPSTKSRRAIAGQAWLIVLTSNQVGQRHAIDNEATIGRAVETDIRLDDIEISRRHARILRSAAGFVIEDLGSSNGTFVNGDAVTTATVLRFGDRVKIGRQLLLFTHYDPAELQLLEQRRLETLGRLGAGVAHDFNNMISVVLSSLDYIDGLETDRPLSSADVRDCLVDIRSAASRAAQLTPKLLSFARGQQGHAPLDLSLLCAEVARLAKRTFPRRIRISEDLNPNLWIMGDDIELHQVLMNLCLNARDAMNGTGTLSLKAASIDEARAAALKLPSTERHVVVLIEDNGPGMDLDTQSHIFEPFFTTKSKGAGFGLGLAAVKEMVSIHGGRVAVRSALGKGSTFAVYLPQISADAKKKHDHDAYWQTADASSPTSGQGEVILLVDDEQVVRRSLARILRHAGYEVVEAPDGRQAIELVRSGKLTPALVVLDIEMPGLSGLEALAALHGLDPRLRVTLTSGKTDATVAQRARNAGAVGFLRKPYAAQELLAMIARSLRATTVVPPEEALEETYASPRRRGSATGRVID